MHCQSLIHPQFPQRCPHTNRRKKCRFHGCSQLYPHYPQNLHTLHPHGSDVWTCLWITHPAPKSMFTHVANVIKYACSCMFGARRLLQLVISGAGKAMNETVSEMRKYRFPKRKPAHPPFCGWCTGGLNAPNSSRRRQRRTGAGAGGLRQRGDTFRGGFRSARRRSVRERMIQWFPGRRAGAAPPAGACRCGR